MRLGLPLPGKLLAITGAGSGIGRALALDAARRGARLALSDIDAAGLAATVQAVGPAAVLHEVFDVASREAMFGFARRVQAEAGGADAIINNAGVSVAQTLSELAPADLEWILGINLWGVVHGTQAFLPQLRARGGGAVVNLSSIFGVVAWPTQGAYSVSKFAVRAYTEALRGELAAEGSRINVLCVMPGGVATSIVRSSRYRLDGGTAEARSGMDQQFQRHTTTTAEQAAARILDGLQAGRRNLLIGADARLMYLLQRLMPLGYQRIVNAILKRAQ